MRDTSRIMKTYLGYYCHLRHSYPLIYVLVSLIIIILISAVDTQPSSSTGPSGSSAGEQQQRRYHHQQQLLSPQQQGLKPASPLEELPPPDLIEPTARADDPRSADLNNISALHLKLGPNNYDPIFMSVVLPTDEDAGNAANFGFRRNRLGRLIPTGVMPDYLSKMDFKYVTLTNGSKLRTKITSKLKRKIQQFLWAYTACSVVYRWKDLGVRFWPRYLKEGYCPQDMSCSIPPGMSCSPSDSTHKTILRWHCKTAGGSGHGHNSQQQQQHNNAYHGGSSGGSTAVTSLGGHNNNNNNNNNNNRHCQWIKVEYPILTECSCACPHGSANKY